MMKQGVTKSISDLDFQGHSLRSSGQISINARSLASKHNENRHVDLVYIIYTTKKIKKVIK